MAKHQVNAKLQARGVSFWDLEIEVVADGTTIGRLFITQDSVDWRPRHSRRTYQLTWARFDELIHDYGTIARSRALAE
jgi:hypothetical protein